MYMFMYTHANIVRLFRSFLFIELLNLGTYFPIMSIAGNSCLFNRYPAHHFDNTLAVNNPLFIYNFTYIQYISNGGIGKIVNKQSIVYRQLTWVEL